jgi:hypothetical protein
MKKSITLILLALSCVALSVYLYSCISSSTVITGTWKKDDSSKNYNHLLVAALTNTASSKAILEQSLAQNLRDNGLVVSKSIDILPPKFIDDRDQKMQLLDSVRGRGIDALLTVSIIDKKTETRYVPGTYDYAPYPTFGYYGTFWGYYDHWYPRFQEPGYYTEDNVYFIETNLYDAKSEELVWSAQSQTYEPINLQTFADEFAKNIISRLIKENIIHGTTNNVTGS